MKGSTLCAARCTVASMVVMRWLVSRRTWFLGPVIVLLIASGAQAASPFLRRSMTSARRAAPKELAAVVLPHGARIVQGDPSVHRALRPARVACPAKYVVRAHEFWRIPGRPAAVQEWMRKHLPKATRSIGFSTASVKAGTAVGPWMIWLFLSDRQNVSREIIGSLLPARGGGTALRVDALAIGEQAPHETLCTTFSY